MTRVNVVPTEELHVKHMRGEYHEITRIFGLTKRAQARGETPESLRRKKKLKEHYTLNTGHVVFFYDKLQHIADRYILLIEEMRKSGSKPNPIPLDSLLEGIHSHWINNYIPTPEALATNRERLALRQPKEVIPKVKVPKQSRPRKPSNQVMIKAPPGMFIIPPIKYVAY